MTKNGVRGSGHITLPKDVRDMRPYIADLFDRSIVNSDPMFVYDLVAVLAWRANTERGRMSNRLKGSSAHRFVVSIDEAIARWENNKKKLSPTLRIYLFSSLFESACDKALHMMVKHQLQGLHESTF